MKIPDIFLLLLLLALVGVDILLDYRAIPLKLLTALGAYGLFYAVYRLKGGLGYGDVKYAGVVGYFLGHERILAGLLCAVLLGLLYWFIGSLLFRWGKEKRFPLGPWLGCGAIAAYFFNFGVT